MPETEISVGEIEHPAIFDAGIFTIQNVSEKGFKLETRESKRRRDFSTPFPENDKRTEADSPFPLTPEESETLKNRMKDETAFALSKAKGQADKEGRTPTTGDYVNQMKPKVGLRNVTQYKKGESDVLSFDIRPVSYPVYGDLVRRESSDPKLLDLGEVTGTASVIFTTDGKLILQYRGKGNRAYGNIPGASAAGMFDGKFDRSDVSKSGTLQEIDPTSNLRTEITEELGIVADVEMKVLALAHDEIKPHHEFILSATIPYSSVDLAEKGLIPDDEEGHDFKERYFTIEGTPEAIDTLLTKVKCPLPSTHAAAFFIAGFQKMSERSGGQAAYNWARDVSTRIKENYNEIDVIVKNKYDELPHQLGNKPIRSRMGYDPLYFPEQQGLPSLLEELKRTELVSEEMYEKLKSKYNPQ